MGFEIFEGIRASHYDKNIRILFPQYDFLLKLLGPLFSEKCVGDELEKLLIVGSGTGNEMVQLHQQLPHIHLTGVDPSPEMVNIARLKLPDIIPMTSYKLVTGHVHDLDLHPKYDGATLLLVLHFISGDVAKLELLNALSSRLKQGAKLVFAEIHDADGSFDFNIELLRRFLIAEGRDEQIVNQLIDHFKKDLHYSSELHLKKLMAEAGFVSFKKVLQSTVFGAWVASKV